MKKRLFSLISLALLPAFSVQASDNPTQLVIISFDGAADNALWEKSLRMAERNKAHFTYFLSCTFLMSPDQKAAYQAPHQGKGRSNVGFALSREEVKTRLGHVWQAHEAGHDIASHGCGHFDGADWSKQDWISELATYRQTLKTTFEANGLETEKPAGWDDFVENGIVGFRAPYLSVSDGLAPALKASGFLYDASLVSSGPVVPAISDTPARFSLPLIPEGPSKRPVIAMDYNLYVRHSKGEEAPDKSAEFEARAYQAFRSEFELQYEGDRIPLQLGFHFVEMNTGAYWRALDRLSSEVCALSDVKCVSYAEALDRLQKNGEKAEVSDPGL